MRIITYLYSFSKRELDLKLTILLTLLSNVLVLIPPLNETIARIVIGLPLVLFLPGYSLVAALFPRREDLGWAERVTLSFGLSIAIVPFLGWGLNYTPFGLSLVPVLILLSTFTISLCIFAWLRRSKLPAEQRFRVPFEKFYKAKILFKGQTIDKALSIILITSIIGSCVTVVYISAIPKTDERCTEFYILGPDGKASDYPTILKVGEEGEVIIGIVNLEGENLTYRLEVKFNGEVIHKEYVLMVQNQTWQVPFTFVARTGEDQNLEFLLYKGEEKEAYRTLHLWIDVE